MPPKQKAAAKDADSADKEQLQKARAEITTLNRLLELKTYEVCSVHPCMAHVVLCCLLGLQKPSCCKTHTPATPTATLHESCQILSTESWMETWFVQLCAAERQCVTG
jgi:hypothetical protein